MRNGVLCSCLVVFIIVIIMAADPEATTIGRV
jgi:hypothetical protein